MGICLPDVARTTLESFEAPEDEHIVDHVKHILHGLFRHFFSKYKKHFCVQDVAWFLKISNQSVQWKSKLSVPNLSGVMTNSVEVVCQINRGVLKFYLRRILSAPEHRQLPTAPYTSVLNFVTSNVEVSLATKYCVSELISFLVFPLVTSTAMLWGRNCWGLLTLWSRVIYQNFIPKLQVLHYR